MSRWQAIVFDLDDTLYPERDYVLSGFGAVAAWAETHLAIPATLGYASLKELYESGVRGTTFNQWLAAHGVEDVSHIPNLVRAYREHTPTLTAFQPIPALLARLRQESVLGLISDGYLEVQRGKFAALELASHFDAVVFSDEWGRDAWKPSTVPFRAVLDKLGVAPGEAVYVADNPLKDFLGARQLGMSTIWLRQPGGEYTHHEPPTEAHNSDLTVASLEALEAVLLADESLDAT